jgi:hypothetical protein
MINLTDEDQAELLFTGVVKKQGLGLLIWALVLAVIVSGMVSCLRAFR